MARFERTAALQAAQRHHRSDRRRRRRGADAANALRAFVDKQGASSAVDEEHFRLITGFNDIFVSIAAAILLFAVGWIGGDIARPLGGFAVAAMSWALAEYFTR